MRQQHQDNRLTPIERRASGALAAVFGLRMLGLFLIMPVIAIYGQKYPDYTPLLIGLAIGAYGLTQALLQIPLGMLSDRIGRRPVIVGGLLLFAVGSLVAATADTLVGVVVGRALQGTGAIAAAILALAADITRDSQRPKVMATIGMFIGLSFALALVLGPLLGAQIGLSGLFYFTAVSAVFGIVVLLLAVPKVAQKSARGDLIPLKSELGMLFKDRQLARLNFGVFVLHCVLTAFFVVVPLQLMRGGLAADDHAWLYLPTLIASFAFMIPMLIKAERQRQQPRFFRVAIALVLGAVAVIVFVPAHWTYLAIAVVLFFTGFNFLEATLPSSLTRFAPAGRKGSASGIYATFQFFGAFVGGAAGGSIYQHIGLIGVGIFCTVLLLCWFAISFGMQPPPQQQSVSYELPLLTATQADGLAEQLSAIDGVEEVRIVAAEKTVYLKVHKTNYNEADVRAQLAPYTA
ncbi:MFS transporter [Pseudidiomarina donghaiensis]|uniref:MFS transporter n=1 Tax=Pseudidiomarina donghaiensis TaxID=519452 RepID=A0A432XKF7_9GAMM|nr:MFS transporter [Pseudidiomarina donghaiensis]RUO49106.1 MFS transporter [Pseudidiomarina donghaiensis]SFV20640.1 Predicted arabinose efflux permease, MFS family [Pseudidiomarina donghaiensis]